MLKHAVSTRNYDSLCRSSRDPVFGYLGPSGSQTLLLVGALKNPYIYVYMYMHIYIYNSIFACTDTWIELHGFIFA